MEKRKSGLGDVKVKANYAYQPPVLVHISTLSYVHHPFTLKTVIHCIQAVS